MSEVEGKPGENERLLTALLVEAVEHRRSAGQITTLRDVHELLETPQPVALRIVQKLEADGVVQIERDIADAFASVVTVKPPVANRLREMVKSWRLSST